MIIVINSRGGLVSQQNEDLFQGSTGANVINLIAPFATNVIFKAVFEMPDGSYKPDIDGYMFEPTIQVVDGLNVWKLIVNFPITQYSGIIKMQLRGMIGNQVVCTSLIKFNVEEGLPYQNNYVEEETYDYLLGLISDLRGLLTDKVNIKKYQYRQAEVNQDTAGVYYVFNVEQNKYIPKTLPTEYLENTTYFEIAIESIITNEDGLYLQFKDNTTGQTMRLQVSGDKATLNDKTIVVFDDLVAKNIAFDNISSGMEAQDLQGAMEELKFEVNNLETAQVVALGDRTISASGWFQDGDIWKYEFTDVMFQNALVQDLVLTPTNKTIEDLTHSDILVYPNVEAYQRSEKVAVGVITANKKPDIDLVFDVKVQGTTISVSTEGIRAGQIIFGATDKIPANNVQNAIVAVQGNVDNAKAEFDDFKTDYAEEKESFAKLVDGKVPASQLPSFVDDVVECYIVAGSAEFSAGWLTTTQGGTALTPETNKVYLIVESGDFENKEYRWSGGRYAVIGNDLALGETSSTAYAGNKGKQNADNILQIENEIEKIITGSTPVANAINAIANVEKSSLDALKTSLAQGYIDQATYNAQVKELYDNATYSGLMQSPSDKVLRVGDEIISKKVLVYDGSMEVKWGNNTIPNITFEEGVYYRFVFEYDQVVFSSYRMKEIILEAKRIVVDDKDYTLKRNFETISLYYEGSSTFEGEILFLGFPFILHENTIWIPKDLIYGVYQYDGTEHLKQTIELDKTNTNFYIKKIYKIIE